MVLNSPTCSQSTNSRKPQLFTQFELNDLVRDLGLPAYKAELLDSRLQEKNLLDPSTNVTAFRKRDELFANFFTTESTYCFCNNIDGVMQALGIRHDPSEWRLPFQ